MRAQPLYQLWPMVVSLPVWSISVTASSCRQVSLENEMSFLLTF
jgi:hypothetical protein